MRIFCTVLLAFAVTTPVLANVSDTRLRAPIVLDNTLTYCSGDGVLNMITYGADLGAKGADFKILFGNSPNVICRGIDQLNANDGFNPRSFSFNVGDGGPTPCRVTIYEYTDADNRKWYGWTYERR